jgi:hypothetical protein
LIWDAESVGEDDMFISGVDAFKLILDNCFGIVFFDVEFVCIDVEVVPWVDHVMLNGFKYVEVVFWDSMEVEHAVRWGWIFGFWVLDVVLDELLDGMGIWSCEFFYQK